MLIPVGVMVVVGVLLLIVGLRRSMPPQRRQDRFVGSAATGDLAALLRLMPLVQVDAMSRSGQLALVAAAGQGHLDIVKALLKAGAQVNVLNRLGTSPLMAAAGTGRLELVQALVGAGAKLELASPRRRLTALQLAVAAGHKPVVQSLIASGAAVHRVLTESAMLGRIDAMRLLLGAGASPDDVGPLRKPVAGRLAAASRADPRTALMWSAAAGQAKMVEVLLTAGAKPNYRSPATGDTAALLAVRGGHDEALRLLGQAGANFELANNARQSAWSLAHETGNDRAIETMLAARRAS